MYIPAPFAESRKEVMHALIQARPLATLVTLSPHGIEANHIPMQLIAEQGEYGVLRGHVARSNTLWHERVPSSEALAVFQGADSYITPTWYPTKREHGKAVPTWNYAVVHAHGPLRIIDDAAWLRLHLEALTTQSEADFATPWAVTDAPHDFIEGLLGKIVGIEMVATKLTGKWKASQNQPPQNRAATIEGLRALGSARAEEMAALMAQASPQCD